MLPVISVKQSFCMLLDFPEQTDSYLKWSPMFIQVMKFATYLQCKLRKDNVFDIAISINIQQKVLTYKETGITKFQQIFRVKTCFIAINISFSLSLNISFGLLRIRMQC